MLLALEGRSESYSRGRGDISPARVDEIWDLAEKHGFTLAPFFNARGLCGDRIAAMGRRAQEAPAYPLLTERSLP